MMIRSYKYLRMGHPPSISLNWHTQPGYSHPLIHSSLFYFFFFFSDVINLFGFRSSQQLARTLCLDLRDLTSFPFLQYESQTLELLPRVSTKLVCFDVCFVKTSIAFPRRLEQYATSHGLYYSKKNGIKVTLFSFAYLYSTTHYLSSIQSRERIAEQNKSLPAMNKKCTCKSAVFALTYNCERQAVSTEETGKA